MTSKYEKPDINLLKDTKESYLSKDEIENMRLKLIEIIEFYGVNFEYVDMIDAPQIIRFVFKMETNDIFRIKTFEDDISSELLGNDNLCIISDTKTNEVLFDIIKEKGCVVGVKELLKSKEFKTNNLSVCIGKDGFNRNHIYDLSSCSPIGVFGDDGNGKSSFIHSLITSLIYKFSSQDLKLLLIDSNNNELSIYNKLPHSLTTEPILDDLHAENALKWCVDEMNRREKLLMNLGVYTVEKYNKIREIQDEKVEKLPYIVLVIDELENVLMTSRANKEDYMHLLLNRGKALGIYAVVSTRNPLIDISKNKTFLSTALNRVFCFKTSKKYSERVLRNNIGYKLSNNGDMFVRVNYLNNDKVERVQSCFVCKEERDNIVDYICKNNEKLIKDQKENNLDSNIFVCEEEKIETKYDELFTKALKIVVESNNASVSLIQRKLCIGFSKAARIIDQMLDAGFIAKLKGDLTYSVLITLDEYNKLFK